MAYGAAVMSAVVTVSFIAVLTLFLSFAFSLDAYQQSVVTILIGYLGAAFQQAVNSGGELLARHYPSVAREGHRAGVACRNRNAGGAA